MQHPMAAKSRRYRVKMNVAVAPLLLPARAVPYLAPDERECLTGRAKRSRVDAYSTCVRGYRGASPACGRRRARAKVQTRAAALTLPVIDWTFKGLTTSCDLSALAASASAAAAASPHSASRTQASGGAANSSSRKKAAGIRKESTASPSVLDGTASNLLLEEPRRSNPDPGTPLLAQSGSGVDAAVLHGKGVVKLAGNGFACIAGLVKSVRSSVVRDIVCLDLSCNRVAHLPSDFGLQLPVVCAVYLHSNCLSDVKELATLGDCSRTLAILTLHGNFSLDAAVYKPLLLSLLPALRSLDFTTITPSDRDGARSAKLLDRKRRHRSPT
ncbi:hypothetical protein DIPPA_15344 [Diplonema papillatum]|nr:hypothetical protein DIPPA_15344 [Diplonema papillatum]